ncbi:pilus assembly protein PilM [Butyrivibrio sp. MC2013]|uniref:pilus assembly protein PilM n=1 Tax=Butyrivibrio sp. MC2013 TaxID=1280686 RepID=UPI00047CA668|nr:pilus assembly protein PilM [Butyrivibrio sp. MC2013]
MAKILSIEIGSSLTEIVEMDYRVRSPKVYKSLMISTPEGVLDEGVLVNYSAFAQALDRMLKKKGFSVKKAIFTVSSSRIACREAEIPYVKDNQIRELVLANAADYFPVDLSEYSVSYTVLEHVTKPDGPGSLRINALAAPIELLDSYRNFAREAGLELEAVDYDGNSIYQAVKKECAVGNQIILKVDENSSIVTVLKEGVQSLTRTVPYGLADAADAVIDSRIYSDNTTKSQAISYLRAIRCVNPAFDMSRVGNDGDHDDGIPDPFASDHFNDSSYVPTGLEGSFDRAGSMGTFTGSDALPQGEGYEEAPGDEQGYDGDNGPRSDAPVSDGEGEGEGKVPPEEKKSGFMSIFAMGKLTPEEKAEKKRLKAEKKQARLEKIRREEEEEDRLEDQRRAEKAAKKAEKKRAREAAKAAKLGLPPVDDAAGASAEESREGSEKLDLSRAMTFRGGAEGEAIGPFTSPEDTDNAASQGMASDGLDGMTTFHGDERVDAPVGQGAYAAKERAAVASNASAYDENAYEEPASEEMQSLRREVTYSFENLISGLSTVLDLYYSRNSGQRLDRIVVTGLGGSVRGLTDLISNTLEVPVEVLGSLEGIQIGKAFKNDSFSEYIGCLGAGLKPVDFLSETKSSGAGADLEKISKYVLIGSLGVSAALMVGAVVPYFAAKMTNDSLRKQVMINAESVSIYQEYTLSRQLNEYLEKAYSLAEVPNDNLVNFIGDLEERLPAGSVVSSISSDASTVSISLMVTGKDEAAEAIRQIRKFETLSDLTVESISDTYAPDASHLVSMTLVGTYKTSEELAMESESAGEYDEDVMNDNEFTDDDSTGEDGQREVLTDEADGE